MVVKIPLKITRTVRKVKPHVLLLFYFTIYFGFWLIGVFLWVLFSCV